jgi:opacity protein-like surface antigen
MKQFLWSVIVLVLFSPLRAQEKEYMYEIGGGLGASWGYGDVNRSSALYDPSLAADLLFRYNFNLRWSVAADLSTSGLKGDSKDFDNVFPGNTRWQFDRRFWQLSIRPEFSFWNYGWGSDYREKHRVAPFLTAGVGFGLSAGSTSAGSIKDKQTNTALTVPLGLGLKWKMAPRWDLQLTALWTRTFGDKADGIADPYGIGTTGAVNTDWIGSVMMSVTFCFKERCLECRNQNSF